MSIGSETFAGVSDILVSDLTMDGTTSGIRIKSDANRGGLVQRVTYRDICMRNVKNPIAIDPYYEHNMAKGEKIPVYRNILLQGVHSLTPGDVTMIATDPQHALALQLDGVIVDKEQESQIHTQFGQFLLDPGKTNLKIAGPGVEQKAIPGAGTAVPECQDRFIPFPSAP
jgi:polygalacturonase